MRFPLTLAARYLGGRNLRTFLTTLAIVIGVMVIFGTGIYLPSFTDAFNKSLLSASGQTDVMITHKTGEAFSASTLKKIQRMPSSPARWNASSICRRTFTAGTRQSTRWRSSALIRRLRRTCTTIALLRGAFWNEATTKLP
jgi:ABC-type lipoprotein release transport system permease subunit